MTEFTWKIEDFETRPQENGDYIVSSTFMVNQPSNEKESCWQLKLFPKGCGPQEREHLSIFLQSNNDFSLGVKFEVSILDSSAQKTNRVYTFDTDFRHLESQRPTLEQRQWASRDSIINNPELLPGGNLTILCVVTGFGTATIFSGSEDVKSGLNKARGLEQVSQHIGKLFNDKEFSDVEIKCGGEIFNCHKAILSTRSDVFRAMFQADMAESRTQEVTIRDMDSEVAREMLHFIYTGGTTEDVLKDKARKLLEAAERYQLGVLKSICEDYLCSNLQISNAIENLIFGDFHQANKLKRTALKVIARNLLKVVKTEEYQNLFKHHPSLGAEIPVAIIEMT